MLDHFGPFLTVSGLFSRKNQRCRASPTDRIPKSVDFEQFQNQKKITATQIANLSYLWKGLTVTVH